MQEIRSDAALRRLNKLANLERGWDGASAEPISLTAIERAADFLRSAWKGPEPDVGPDYDGSVVLEWERAAGPVSIATFQPDGQVRVHVFDDETSMVDVVTQPANAAALITPFMVNSDE